MNKFKLIPLLILSILLSACGASNSAPVISQTTPIVIPTPVVDRNSEQEYSYSTVLIYIDAYYLEFPDAQSFQRQIDEQTNQYARDGWRLINTNPLISKSGYGSTTKGILLTFEKALNK